MYVCGSDFFSPPREAYATNAVCEHMYVWGGGPWGMLSVLSAPPPWGRTLCLLSCSQAELRWGYVSPQVVCVS